MEGIFNVRFEADQWIQATLPIRYGGLGLRRVRDVSIPAFLASAHGVAGLVTDILSCDGDRANIPFAADAMAAWEALNPTADPPTSTRMGFGAEKELNHLVERAVDMDLVRLKAVSQAEAGAWLHTLPSPHMGTLLDCDSLRVAVALRLGCDVCE